jgi:hypothetical protein
VIFFCVHHAAFFFWQVQPFSWFVPWVCIDGLCFVYVGQKLILLCCFLYFLCALCTLLLGFFLFAQYILYSSFGKLFDICHFVHIHMFVSCLLLSNLFKVEVVFKAIFRLMSLNNFVILRIFYIHLWYYISYFFLFLSLRDNVGSLCMPIICVLLRGRSYYLL